MTSSAARRAAPARIAAIAALAAGIVFASAPARADEEPVRYLQFVEELAGNCVARGGMQILVKNLHPTRRLRVWLDRYHMGIGTGDRSRSDLAPGAEPEPLGCSRSSGGPQEWRVVRVVFID